jgi:hypothetical protein
VPDDAEEKVVNKWLIEPENALPEITIDSLPEISKAACQKAGWKELMPVQARAILYVFAAISRRHKVTI